jgi:hypothetical protein
MKTLDHLAKLAKKPCETFIISDGVGQVETRVPARGQRDRK